MLSPDHHLPSDAACRAELARVIESSLFRTSPRLTAFLRFVVERTLAGEAAQLKGYTIATEALGRDAGFDPQIDPIVRVEAGRLRRRLEFFYASEGADDPVVIELPRGHYVPCFRMNESRRLPPGMNSTTAETLHVLQKLVRQQLAAFDDAIRNVRVAIAQTCTLLQIGAAAAACPPSAPLLPTAPHSRDGERLADGRKIRQIEQAQGTAAARSRRPRAGRDRGNAAHDRRHSRGL